MPFAAIRLPTTTAKTTWDESPEDEIDVGISRSFQSSPQLQKIFNGHAHAQVRITRYLRQEKFDFYFCCNFHSQAFTVVKSPSHRNHNTDEGQQSEQTTTKRSRALIFERT